MKRIIIFAAVAVLATSCAAPAASTAPAPVKAEASPTPTATTLPAGKFKLSTLSGAEIKFTLPTPLTDPSVAKLEAYRKKVGAKPVAYLVAEVDNRKGTKPVNMYQVNAFDADGIQYMFSGVTDAISEWKPSYQADDTYLLPSGKVIPGDAGTPLSNEGSDLHSAFNEYVDVAERKTVVLQSATTEIPKEFTRVSVQPSGGGEGEDALPAS